jgi:MOSC domain-containing protein YiiM
MLMQELQSKSGRPGIVSWIGIRPHRSADLLSLEEVDAVENKGLQGDHYSNPGGPRQITLIQAEHLSSIASFLGVQSLHPNLTRRNLVINGFNLLSLKGQEFFIGECRLKYSGDCHPCSRMEKNLGAGGYHAMRGLGGITATVIKGGKIRIGDLLHVAPINKVN